jgi:RNA polymerase sigma-70 factor (ECF subfamily)
VGDRSESFEAFFGEHYESVFRGLSVAFHEPLLAEEATQEAFTRAYTRWERVSGMERPAGWVYVVAVRVARRRRRDLLGDAPVRSAGSEPDLATEVVDRVTLQAAIEQLPSRQRLALVLRYYGGLPLDQIATAMGCALGTVKSTLHAAHARLLLDLEDEVEIPEVELDAP